MVAGYVNMGDERLMVDGKRPARVNAPVEEFRQPVHFFVDEFLQAIRRLNILERHLELHGHSLV